MSGNNPIRIVLDKSLRIPMEYHIFDGIVKTIIFVDKSTKVNQQYSTIPNLIMESINFKQSVIEQLLEVLFKHEIQSVIVEGGKMLLESFIQQNYWDEARVFVGSPTFVNGVKAPSIKGIKIQETTIFDDILTIYQNTSNL